MNENIYYWQKVVGNKSLDLNLRKIKEAVSTGFKSLSDNYKQKLVYNLLETIRNNDQKNFFNILLKTINKPNDENYMSLWKELNQSYYAMPEEAFINFGYTIIIGIMSTYNNNEGK
ncbi:MAG: hypothetical protein ACP5RS_06775 [Thermoplasmata archaeon]